MDGKIRALFVWLGRDGLFIDGLHLNADCIVAI
jgi:hypothetical protein